MEFIQFGGKLPKDAKVAAGIYKSVKAAKKAILRELKVK